MPRRPHPSRTPYPPRPWLTLPVRADPEGLLGPTPKQARGPHWRRVASGLYVPASVVVTPAQRVLEAAARLPTVDRRPAAVTGWAGLCWAGARWFDGTTTGGAATRPITLAVGARGALRPGLGVLSSKERLRPGEVVEVAGVRVTVPIRSVLFEVRHAATLQEAVTAIDMACFDDLVSVADVAAAVDELAAWTGVEQARQAVALAEENAWSPAEVDLRLLCADAGLVGLRCNAPVFDVDGRHVGTPDLIDPATGMLLEYDSRLHLTSSGRTGDLRRVRAYRAVGLEPVVVVDSDLRRRAATAELLRAEHGRAATRGAVPRRWTLRTPPWWTHTETVEQRRRLSVAQASRLLAHRRAVG